MSGLRIENLTVRLDGRRIVDGVSAELPSGRLVGLIGPNGVGKSTLLRAVAGVIPAAEGRMSWNGQDLAPAASRQRARQVAYLPQGQTVHWPLDVHQLVALGRLPHLAPLSRIADADERAIAAAMARADVSAFAARPATELSAGERARALLARALAVEADILLADEPTAALDPLHQLQVMRLLRDLAGEGRLVVVVLHDLALAARFCDQLMLLRDGRVHAAGAPSQVLTAENLAEVYGVEAYFTAHEGAPVILPWRPRSP